MDYVSSGRGWLTDLLAHLLMGGIKALRFVISARYRQRVHEHWQRYPDLRWRGIVRMIAGFMLLVLVLLGALLLMRS